MPKRSVSALVSSLSHEPCWYTRKSKRGSNGFAPNGQLSLNSADTQNSDGSKRLSWHLGYKRVGGYRSGNTKGSAPDYNGQDHFIANSQQANRQWTTLIHNIYLCDIFINIYIYICIYIYIQCLCLSLSLSIYIYARDAYAVLVQD